MGLLDRFSNLNEEQADGLLAAAARGLQMSGPSRTPTSFGQVAGGAIESFQSGMNATKRRRQEEQQAHQLEQLRALQITEAQGGLQDSEAKRLTAQRVAQFHEDRRKRSGQPQPLGMGGQPAQGMASAFPGAAGSPRIGGPDWMQSYQSTLPPDQQSAVARLGQLPEKSDKQQSIFEERLALAKEMRIEGLDAQADQIEEHAYKTFRPKFSTTPQVMAGPDGKLRNYQVSEDGSTRDMGLGVKPDMVELGLGDRKQFVDKNTMRDSQSYKVGVSPDSVYSGGITMRGQNMTNARGIEDNRLKALEIGMGGKPPPGYRWSADGKSQVAIPGGPGDKLPESQQKQVVGVNNLSNAIREYRAELPSFGKDGVVSPDARARMGTKYNNMMLQAKEAYNLGVLNGPDLSILTSVITDPRSFKGFVTSTSALDKQASELDRIMQDVGLVSGQARQPQNGGAPLRTDKGSGAGEHSVVAPNGKTYTFPTAKALLNFKLSAGIK